MATVQKRPRRLPKLPDRTENEDSKGKQGGRGDIKARKADSSKTSKLELPPPGKKRDLPPIRRGGKKGEDETRSMIEMGKSSPVEFNQRTSLTATENAKTCYFYIDNNYEFPPIREIIHSRRQRKIETLTRDLSVRMKSLPFGVRAIYTPRGKDRIHTLEDLSHDGHYICTSNRKKAKGLDVQRVCSKRIWHHNRPESGKRSLSQLLKDFEPWSAKRIRGFRPGHDMANVYRTTQPINVMVMKNGEPDKKHVIVLNRRTTHTFEQVLKDLSELFLFAVRKLYTTDGRQVSICIK